MNRSTSVKGYSRTQIALHWGIAVLIILQFVLHDAIVAAWEARSEGLEWAFTPLVAAHVFGGITILALACWRLVVRFRRGVPPLPEKESAVMKGAAHVTHWSLYALMIGLPLTGMATWFAGSTLADTIHTSLKFPLLLIFALHVLAALFQQFVLKTGLMQRMMRAQS